MKIKKIDGTLCRMIIKSKINNSLVQTKDVIEG